jgi:hypothetical protein
MPSVMRASVNGEAAGTGREGVVTVRLSNPIAPNTVEGVTIMLVTVVADV